MEKRLLLALAISWGILYIWTVMFPPPKRPIPVQTVAGAPTPLPQEPTPVPTVQASSVEPSLTEPSQSQPSALEETPEGTPVSLDNAVMDAAFSSPSGRLKSVKLLKFKEEAVDVQDLQRKLAKFRGPEKLKVEALLERSLDRLSQKESLTQQIQSSSGEERSQLEAELQRLEALEMMPQDVPPEVGVPLALREVKGSYLRGGTIEAAAEKEIVISYRLENGLVLRQSLRLGDEYIMDMVLSWENPTSERLSWATLRGYQLEWGGTVGLKMPFASFTDRFTGPAARLNWKVDKRPEASLQKEVKKNQGLPIIQYGEVQWLTMRGKYFMAAMIPESQSAGVQYVAGKESGAGISLIMNGVTVEPGQSLQHRIQLYLGPKDYDLVRAQTFSREGVGLEKAVDLSYYAIFEDLSLLLLRALEGFKKVTRDYGLAVILLTIVVKILFFPLTYKSITSMRRMQELNPIMQQMKVQYKNNPKLLQQEMSKIYRKHKVNPLSGCLPMMFQMPVFITLYGTLSTSIRLRGQPFLSTWVRDLSAPDTVGHFPEGIPILAGMPFNVLPLIMVVLMVIQQKLTTPPAITDEQIQQQKMMAIMMPLFFLFITYNMPSGLVLYWLVQNGLSIGEQALVKKLRPLKKIEHEVEPAPTGKKGSKKR